jgi:Zn-dependent protease
MMATVIEALVWYAVFLFSTTLHEAAHAFVAHRGGDPTAYHGGQVSLDPIPHIKRSPFGMVVLPIISLFMFGWPLGFASAPYDSMWAHDHPRRAGWMAFAGPASNLALVLVSAFAIRTGIAAGVFGIPESIGIPQVAEASSRGTWENVALVLGMFFCLNLVLAVLNMIPLPPLDGNGVLTLTLSEESARRWNAFTSNPMFAMFGLLIAWHLFDPLFDAIFMGAVGLLYPEARYF